MKRKGFSRTNKEAVLKGAKEAFFKAMLVGYASGEVINPDVKVEVKKNRWGKIVTSQIGSFKVIDQWWTTPFSDNSAGTTTILFIGVPVWWMSYHGNYPEKVIPLLKKALVAAYKKQWFYCARGLRFLHDESLDCYYINFSEGDFSKFGGREEIRDHRSGITLGHHEFHGRSLID